jgi:hypothetical protein
MLSSKRSTYLVSYLSLSVIGWLKESSAGMLLFMEILDLISRVHLASFVIILPK